MSDKRFYSQHQEDFYLWSVIHEQNLHDIPKRCVEIGACDGKYLSNTRAFAEAGWEAWFVEPCPKWHAALTVHCAELPNAKIVKQAVGEVDGEVDFVVDDATPDHSFVADVEHLVHHRGDKSTVRVPCLTYATLANMMAGPVGLLSVDAEGFDTSIIRQVMESRPLKPLPWLIVVESIIQLARREQCELLFPHYHLLNILDMNTVWVRRDVAARWIGL